jgi:hypothetical protein
MEGRGGGETQGAADPQKGLTSKSDKRKPALKNNQPHGQVGKQEANHKGRKDLHRPKTQPHGQVGKQEANHKGRKDLHRPKTAQALKMLQEVTSFLNSRTDGVWPISSGLTFPRP